MVKDQAGGGGLKDGQCENEKMPSEVSMTMNPSTCQIQAMRNDEKMQQIVVIIITSSCKTLSP